MFSLDSAQPELTLRRNLIGSHAFAATIVIRHSLSNRSRTLQPRSLYSGPDSALESKLATHAFAFPNALRVDSPMTGLAGYARTGPESLSFPECTTSW
jgi:hypothetical protein